MRDSLALALIRAELCRVRLAEPNRPHEQEKHRRTRTWVGRAWRACCRIAGGNARRRAAVDAAPPPDERISVATVPLASPRRAPVPLWSGASRSQAVEENR
jgi:hypothetical protein